MQGLITVIRIHSGGKLVSNQKAVDYGWIRPGMAQPAGWGLTREEIPLGFNLTVDGGRQALAYLFGGKAPLANFTCSKFGIGTGTTAPNASDIALEAPVNVGVGSGALFAATGQTDFPDAMVARVELNIPANSDANGTLITELGLFTSEGTLLCRKVNTGISKNSSFEPTLLWRVRF